MNEEFAGFYFLICSPENLSEGLEIDPTMSRVFVLNVAFLYL